MSNVETMTNLQMIQIPNSVQANLLRINALNFEFVSDFAFEISDLARHSSLVTRHFFHASRAGCAAAVSLA